MSRWSCVALLVLCAGVGSAGAVPPAAEIAPGVPPAAEIAPGAHPTAEIAPGVHLQAGVLQDWGAANDGRVANGGYIVGARCVAVIDPGGSVVAGRALRASIARATKLPVCYVVLTHAHPDHVLGSAALGSAPGDAPQVVGHERLAAALAARGPHYLNAVQREFGAAVRADTRIVAPTLAVRDRLEIDLGDRVLELAAWPTSHTDADRHRGLRRAGMGMTRSRA